MGRVKRALVPAVAVLALTACGATEDPTRRTPEPVTTTATPSASETTPATPSAQPRVVATIARNLEVPWGIAFLPDGSALVTERDSGRVLRITGQGGSPTEVGQVDQARSSSESGLLGIAVSPSYATDRQVFLYATTDTDNRVLRTTFDGDSLGTLTPVLTGIPKGNIHDGGRLTFGPDGYLYVSTGDAGESDHAQQRDSLGGKILRITTDGDPAPGNPYPDSPVWSMGHRNVQGLAFADDGRLWASEFGQDTWDELNLIRAAGNYGWPLVEGKGDLPEYRDPRIVWRTSEASPSGLAYADGRLWMASLRGERLWRIDVNGSLVSKPRDFFVGKYGRMRTVVVAPDGTLWVTTSNRDGRGDPASADDRILQIAP